MHGGPRRRALARRKRPPLRSAWAWLNGGVALGTLWACAQPQAQPPVSASAPTGLEVEIAAADTLDTFSRMELLGQFDPATHSGFESIPSTWTDKNGIYLRAEVLEAYGRMKAAADQAGIQLVIRSATRNFEYQRGIWERKWQRPQYMGWQDIDKARDILTYSAMPGASRHHWGTDIDLNSFENEWFTSGEGADIYAWLTAHASDFGFHQVYDDKSTGRTGYELERWHWSYLPTAGPMLTAYNRMVGTSDLTKAAFSGALTADSLNVLQEFVNGIDLPAPYRNTER